MLVLAVCKQSAQHTTAINLLKGLAYHELFTKSIKVFRKPRCVSLDQDATSISMNKQDTRRLSDSLLQNGLSQYKVRAELKVILVITRVRESG